MTRGEWDTQPNRWFVHRTIPRILLVSNKMHVWMTSEWEPFWV